MKPVNFSDPAAAELIAAIQWYEQRRISLGGELFDAVSATIELIRSHPDAGAHVEPLRPPASSRFIGFRTTSSIEFATKIFM